MLNFDQLRKCIAHDLQKDCDPVLLRTVRDVCYQNGFQGHSVTPEEVRAYEFFAKCEDLPGLPPPQSAHVAFVADQCRSPIRHTVGSLDFRVLRSTLKLLLGPIDAGLDDRRHGPGATKDRFTSHDKWLACIAHGSLLSESSDPLNRLPRVDKDYCSRFYSVPKTAWKERGICAEPTWLQFMQQGIGRVLARRIHPFVVVSSQERNRVLAALPGYRTIDLSAASDAIDDSWSDYFPDDWWDLFQRTRSTFCSVDSEIIMTRSLASMGNGYCFALLSLVCAAIVLTAIQVDSCTTCTTRDQLVRLSEIERFAVFGDDIVVHADIQPQVLRILTNCGFQVNFNKTSFSDSLKETCGRFIVGPRKLDVIPRIRRIDTTVPEVARLQRVAYMCGYAKLSGYLKKVLVASTKVVSLPVVPGDFTGTNVVFDNERSAAEVIKFDKRLYQPYVVCAVYGRPKLRDSSLGDGVAFAAHAHDTWSDMELVHFDPTFCGSRRVYLPALGRASS